MDSPSPLSRETEAVGRAPRVLLMTLPCRSGQSGRPRQGLSLPPPGAARSYRWACWLPPHTPRPPADQPGLQQPSTKPALPGGQWDPCILPLKPHARPGKQPTPGSWARTGHWESLDTSCSLPGTAQHGGGGPGCWRHLAPPAAPSSGRPHSRCSVSASHTHCRQLGLLVVRAGTGAGRLGPDAAPAAVQLHDLRPSAFQPSSPSVKRGPQRGSLRMKQVEVLRSTRKIISLTVFPPHRHTSPKQSDSLYNHLASSYSPVEAHQRQPPPGSLPEAGLAVLASELPRALGAGVSLAASFSHAAGCASREGGLSAFHLSSLL